ncbi:hypothetical protein DH2020_034955 [Rehmannia glutinosa]|uniref:Vacuolar protein sorting-associated protein 35 n=1 Tax=Rehmannia glutinosa TaxID=99300 RepID=A0ABR0VBI4_REHGL
MMISNGIEDEEKWLAEGIAGIQHNAFYLHRALDANNLREALKFSAQLLSELRTSRLSPHKYYELYMRAFDELRRLEMFFKDEDRHGCSVVDLYELVQHAGNILPRFKGDSKKLSTLANTLRRHKLSFIPSTGVLCRKYLLCTVGSVYIKSKEAPAKDVLKDLVEMCRAVQHPIRGLFLRSYLAQVSRDKLPDIGSEYEGEGDTVMDAVEFVLQNFTEMNKLWVRMQHQVGKNLHVLSQIEGVDLEIYRDTVLPRVLEQVFPDEYHLQTLEILLGACPQLQVSGQSCDTYYFHYIPLFSFFLNVMMGIAKRCFISYDAWNFFNMAFHVAISGGGCENVRLLWRYPPVISGDFLMLLYSDSQPTVDLKTVLSQLMERLSNYASSSPELLPEFLQVEAFSKLSNAIGKVIEAQADMPIVGAITLYVSLLTFTLRVHPDRLDYVDQVLGACVKKLSGKPKLEDSKATKQVVALLSAPLDNIMKNKTCVSTSDKVEVLFELIKGLIKDLEGISTDELDEEDFNEEQNSVACLMHMLYNDDPEEMLQIICTVWKHIKAGGSKRLPFTVPPLVFSALKLVRKLQGQDGDVAGEEVPATPKKIFQLLNQIIEALSVVPSPELALRLYLQCAEAANDCDLEPMAYEFFTQAFVLYEEEVADSKAQYSAKLLKKPDQCRAVYACSHLFWVDDQDGIKDGERVLLCLKRSLRIANAAQQMANVTRGSSGPVTLFVEILNKYLYFFEKGNPQITSSVIQGLIELIKTEMQSDSTTANHASDAFFTSTLRYIQFQKQKGGAMGEKYDPIKL